MHWIIYMPSVHLLVFANLDIRIYQLILWQPKIQISCSENPAVSAVCKNCVNCACGIVACTINYSEIYSPGSQEWMVSHTDTHYTITQSFWHYCILIFSSRPTSPVSITIAKHRGLPYTEPAHKNPDKIPISGFGVKKVAENPDLSKWNGYANTSIYPLTAVILQAFIAFIVQSIVLVCVGAC